MWQMLTLIVLFFSTYIYFNIRKKRTVFTLFTLFAGLWVVIIILGTINVYNMYKVSDRFYFLLFLGIFSWIIGFFLGYINRFTFVIRRRDILQSSYNFDIRKGTLIFYNIVLLAFVIALTFVFFNHMTSHSYGEFHNLAFGYEEDNLFVSNIANMLYNRLMYPITIAMVPVIVISFIAKKERLKCSISLVIIVLYCMLVGRRFPILYLAIDFVIALPFFNFKISTKQKKRVLCLVIVSILVIIFVTAWRRRVFETGDWSLVFQGFYTYLNTCLQIGDHWINQIDEHYKNTLLYGYSFFDGILINLNAVFKQFGITIFNNEFYSKIIDMPQETFINVASNMRYNAFATWIYFFYIDFRELGVILGSLFFGTVCGYIERLTFQWKTIIWIAVYLLFSQAVFKSFVRWEFNQGSYILSYLFMILLFKRTLPEKGDHTHV